eukprot:maker-scaffold112_size353035-snap-gene-2.34 protein:Tk07401 transcript:maker-scaffold112_size353035-snap-gene-2.34-mRNA-1 annotation:"hypothetical protein DAPPUDRAFT_307215"
MSGYKICSGYGEFHILIEAVSAGCGNMRFIVTSDDPDWCRTEFGSLPEVKDGIHFAADFYPQLPKDIEAKWFDMCVMSKCNHSIIDYGTFGFWGAYLAGGHTVLAHHIGTGINTEVENIKPANLSNWHFIDAHPPK